MSIFAFFKLLSLFYVLIAFRCVYRVITRWNDLWDSELTQDDLRLARQAAFFLLIPPTVALHELGHAALIWANGLKVVDWEFLGYMGWVAHVPAGDLANFAIALAGNVVTLAIGVITVAWGLGRPGHPVRNILWIEVGRQSLFLVLVFYPLICLGFDGDFVTIYDFDKTPIASGITAVCHGILLALGYGVLWKRKWKPRADLLCSAFAPAFVALERRLAADDKDHAAHRDLGMILYAAGDQMDAYLHLKKAIDGGISDPKLRMVYGTVLSARGEHEAAIMELARSLDGLLRPEDRLLAELPLARSLLATGRKEEARAMLGELIDRFPKNAEVRELYDRAR